MGTSRYWKICQSKKHNIHPFILRTRQFPFSNYKRTLKEYSENTHTRVIHLSVSQNLRSRAHCLTHQLAMKDFRSNGSWIKPTVSDWATAPLPEKHPVVKAGDSYASHFWLSSSQWLIALTVKRRIKACLISVLLSRTMGLLTPPPDRLKYHLVSVIFSLCRYKQTMNKYLFRYYFHFPSIWEWAVGVFFLVSLKNNAYFLACKITGFGHQVKFP